MMAYHVKTNNYINTQITKSLLICLLISVSSSVFAFNTQIANNSSKSVTLKAMGSAKCTIYPKSEKTCELDSYTTYQAVYAGQWADQGLFTLQKFSNQLLQMTPVDYNQALTGFKVDIMADGVEGYVYNLKNNSGAAVYSGSCYFDMGGVTCKLANGDSLKNLKITLSEARP